MEPFPCGKLKYGLSRVSLHEAPPTFGTLFPPLQSGRKKVYLGAGPATPPPRKERGLFKIDLFRSCFFLSGPRWKA